MDKNIYHSTMDFWGDPYLYINIYMQVHTPFHIKINISLFTFVFIECMIGDVNMFFSRDEDGPNNCYCAEVEIMIAGTPRGGMKRERNNL